jgi:hypothetical protein
VAYLVPAGLAIAIGLLIINPPIAIPSFGYFIVLT